MNKNYPKNWHKASKTLRRVVGCCELCGLDYPVDQLQVHHIGANYINGLPGDPHDKHDLRRENLQSICVLCHSFIDNTPSPYASQAERSRVRKLARLERRRERIEAHRSLNIGTGLVPCHPTRALICMEVTL